MSQVLLTGGTGFIGTFVARWLLANTDDHIFVLVRGKDRTDPSHHLERVWWDWPDLIGAIGTRIEVVPGDITVSRLGLSHEQYLSLVKRIDVIIHAAADIQLNAPMEEMRRVNVEGTRNIVELAEEVHNDHGLARLSHVSTAYVAGGRKGRVKEEDLTDENGFFSNYERSKFEAEILVKSKKDRFPISIFRPGMVVGSSVDGYVRTFNTLYYPLRLYLSGKGRTFPISPSQKVNLVPVDYVASSIGRLTSDPAAAGRTFHVVSPSAKQPSVRELVRFTRAWAKSNLGVDLPRPIFLPASFGRFGKDYEAIAPYLQEQREFDRSNMDALLGPYPYGWKELLPPILEFATYSGFLHRSDRTVHEQVLFRLRSRRLPVRLFDIHEGVPIERKASDVRDEMVKAASALSAVGVKKGDRVAIVGCNSTRYLTLDVAIGMIGAVSVPLYYTSPPRELDAQIASSGAKMLLIGSDNVMARVGEMASDLPIISFCSKVPDKFSERVISWEAFLQKDTGMMIERSPVGFSDLATLRYTSSTTGSPKGVLFRHENLRFMAESTASLPPWHVRNSEVHYLSFLPMNHVVEGILATYSPFYAPSPVNLYFLEDFRQLQAAMRLVRPTVFFSVPRFYEKVYDGIMKNKLARGSLGQGWKNFLLAPLVRRKVRRSAGIDRCEYLISGSGNMSNQILNSLRSIGIEVHNAYGLTEAPLVTINHLGHNRIGTVGVPLPRTKIMIAEDDEVLVQGPQVTSGYDGTTDQPFRNGWLLTGDIGHLTANGSLVLDGRKKELIKTAYGKYVNPAKVEAMIHAMPGVDEAMLVGEGRPYCVALLVVGKDAILEDIDANIEKMNGQLSHPEQVKAWVMLPDDLSIESGELTANLKLKRKKLEQRYSSLIDHMYSDSDPPENKYHIGRARRPE